MRESLLDRLVGRIIIVVLVLFALIMIFPLYYITVISFTDPTYYYKMQGMVFLPLHLSLDAFKFLFSTNAILKAFSVSLYLAIVGTACSLTVNASFSYAVSRKRMRGRKFMLLAVLLTMVFNPGIIPPYLNVRNLHLIDSLWSLILPVLTSGWYVILMKGFFDSIPQSLEEAAHIDGCDDVTIWFRIILPLSMPSIAAFSMFYMVGYWNTYLTAVFYINKPSLWPLQVIVRSIIDSASGVASEAAAEMQGSLPNDMLRMAAVVIAVVPILTVYPFLQKHFVKGAMLGSIKE